MLVPLAFGPESVRSHNARRPRSDFRPRQLRDETPSSRSHMLVERRRALEVADGDVDVMNRAASAAHSSGPASSWRGKSSAVSNHAIRLRRQMWYSGATADGSSRLATVTSTVRGSDDLRNASCVPQLPQNSRWLCTLDANSTGRPFVYANPATGTVSHASTGAPLERWQRRQ